MPLSAEYRSNGGSPALLEALAQATGGRLNIAPGQSFDANATSQGAVREIGLPLLWLALLLLPLDIALRRLLLARRQPAATLRWPELLRAARRPTTTQEQPASPRSVKRPNAANTQASELDQLREAQERARRRARGED